MEHFEGTRNQYAQSKVGRQDRIIKKQNPNDYDNGGHLIATIFNGDGNLLLEGELIIHDSHK